MTGWVALQLAEVVVRCLRTWLGSSWARLHAARPGQFCIAQGSYELQQGDARRVPTQ